MVRVWTGADDAVFHPDPTVEKRKIFTAVFRGGFLPATGIEHVLSAARLLLDRSDIRFLVIGRGMLENDVRSRIEKEHLSNVELITSFVPDDELRRLMLSCHVALGQFASHERMERTIQNKTFEALALGLPYITRDSPSNRELLTDRETCLFVPPDDPEALAQAIISLKDHEEMRREHLGNAAWKLYEAEASPQAIGRRIMYLLLSLVVRRAS